MSHPAFEIKIPFTLNFYGDPDWKYTILSETIQNLEKMIEQLQEELKKGRYNEFHLIDQIYTLNQIIFPLKEKRELLDYYKPSSYIVAP